MKYQYSRSPAFPQLRGGLPLIEISLCNGEHKSMIPALVDSGAAMSVLPYDTGLELGLIWEDQAVPVDVGGSFERHIRLWSTVERRTLFSSACAAGVCMGTQ
ncbi:MAG: hypothetical protein R2941_07665 [Desulfobacterales bacterium]